MAVGDIISATRYNVLQTAINQTLGIGNSTFGYGQAVRSVAIAATNQVSATHMQRLYGDILDCYAHQTGTTPNVSQLPPVITQQDITNAVYADYEEFVQLVGDASNRFKIHSGYATVTNKTGVSSSRSAAWGGAGEDQIISHSFTVTFTTADARRNFFNSGGQIRFSAALNSGTGAKASGWAAMLSSMGTIIFDYDGTTANSGSASVIGNFELTGSYQTIFTKTGSGTYSDSSYTIAARGDVTTNVITFEISFRDGLNNVTDESVTGTIVSNISERRATGPYVEVPTPAYSSITTL
jgi:hypothetical protein